MEEKRVTGSSGEKGRTSRLTSPGRGVRSLILKKILRDPRCCQGQDCVLDVGSPLRPNLSVVSCARDKSGPCLLALAECQEKIA